MKPIFSKKAFTTLAIHAKYSTRIDSSWQIAIEYIADDEPDCEKITKLNSDIMTLFEIKI